MLAWFGFVSANRLKCKWLPGCIITSIKVTRSNFLSPVKSTNNKSDPEQCSIQKWILANASCSYSFRTFRVQREFVCASRHLWGLFLQQWGTFNNESSCLSKTTFISMAHLLAVFTNTVRAWYSSGCPEELFSKKNTKVRTQKMSFQAHSPL